MNIGLDAHVLKQVTELLNTLLASEFGLYVKTLNYHWNVFGKHFGALHAFFKTQYEQLFEINDEIAERIVTFGHIPYATLTEFSKNNKITAQEQAHIPDLQMFADLLDSHEQIIREIRKSIDATAKLNDMGTNNFLCDLIERHEKMAWMLRAHVTQ